MYRKFSRRSENVGGRHNHTVKSKTVFFKLKNRLPHKPTETRNPPRGAPVEAPKDTEQFTMGSKSPTTSPDVAKPRDTSRMQKPTNAILRWTHIVENKNHLAVHAGLTRRRLLFCSCFCCYWCSLLKRRHSVCIESFLCIMFAHAWLAVVMVYNNLFKWYSIFTQTWLFSTHTHTHIESQKVSGYRQPEDGSVLNCHGSHF